MDAGDLTEDQRQDLIRLLSKHREGVNRIRKRMQARNWFTMNATLNAVIAAEHALQAAVSSIPGKPHPPAVQRMLDNLHGH